VVERVVTRITADTNQNIFFILQNIPYRFNINQDVKISKMLRHPTSDFHDVVQIVADFFRLSRDNPMDS
jgi:hypothetical protein